MKAYPLAIDGRYIVLNEGMDLRDYFAAKAMQGVLSDMESRISIKEYAEANGRSFAKEVSVQSYDLADAMMEAREI